MQKNMVPVEARRELKYQDKNQRKYILSYIDVLLYAYICRFYATHID